MSTSQRCQSMTVADLIRSLAATEDALRPRPRRRPDGSFDPRRRQLLQEQAAICSVLRQRRLEMAHAAAS